MVLSLLDIINFLLVSFIHCAELSIKWLKFELKKYLIFLQSETKKMYLWVQVDSPIVILQQDEAKELLKIESPQQLYRKKVTDINYFRRLQKVQKNHYSHYLEHFNTQAK